LPDEHDPVAEQVPSLQQVGAEGGQHEPAHCTALLAHFNVPLHVTLLPHMLFAQQ
jgi:hypothetical protein